MSRRSTSFKKAVASFVRKTKQQDPSIVVTRINNSKHNIVTTRKRALQLQWARAAMGK